MNLRPVQVAALAVVAVLAGCGGDDDEAVYCGECGPTAEIVVDGGVEYRTDFAITVVASDAATGWPVAGADARFTALWGRGDDVIVRTDRAGHAAYVYSEVHPPEVDPVSGWVVELHAPGYRGFTSSLFELSAGTPTAVFDIELAPRGY